MGLRDNGVDQVRLGGQALEEHVAARCVVVALRVYVGEIWLCKYVFSKHSFVVNERVYLNNRQELLDLTRLDRLDLQLDLFGMVLRCCGLKPEVER